MYYYFFGKPIKPAIDKLKFIILEFDYLFCFIPCLFVVETFVVEGTFDPNIHFFFFFLFYFFGSIVIMGMKEKVADAEQWVKECTTFIHDFQTIIDEAKDAADEAEVRKERKKII